MCTAELSKNSLGRGAQGLSTRKYIHAGYTPAFGNLVFASVATEAICYACSLSCVTQAGKNESCHCPRTATSTEAYHSIV